MNSITTHCTYAHTRIYVDATNGPLNRKRLAQVTEAVKTAPEGIPMTLRVTFTASLKDLIEAEGMDDWNERVENATGLSLNDLSYGVLQSARDGADLTLWVEGDWDATSNPYTGLDGEG